MVLLNNRQQVITIPLALNNNRGGVYKGRMRIQAPERCVLLPCYCELLLETSRHSQKITESNKYIDGQRTGDGIKARFQGN